MILRAPEEWKAPILPSSRFRDTKEGAPPRGRQVLWGVTERRRSRMEGGESRGERSSEGKERQSFRTWAKEDSTSFIEEIRMWWAKRGWKGEGRVRVVRSAKEGGSLEDLTPGMSSEVPIKVLSGSRFISQSIPFLVWGTFLTSKLSEL